jgi:hypothetical protein
MAGKHELHEKGLRLTPQRELVLSAVRALGHATPEEVKPPQFAQRVGLLFAVVAILGAVTGLDLVFTIAVAGALGAAFLNAAFNFCLGCEIYLLLLRARSK